MVKIMYTILLEATKTTFVATIFIAINVNEIMPIDNTQRISIIVMTFFIFHFKIPKFTW
jgi:hypothetical protein